MFLFRHMHMLTTKRARRLSPTPRLVPRIMRSLGLGLPSCWTGSGSCFRGGDDVDSGPSNKLDIDVGIVVAEAVVIKPAFKSGVALGTEVEESPKFICTTSTPKALFERQQLFESPQHQRSDIDVPSHGVIRLLLFPSLYSFPLAFILRPIFTAVGTVQTYPHDAITRTFPFSPVLICAFLSEICGDFLSLHYGTVIAKSVD